MIRTITTWPNTSATIAANTAGRRSRSAIRGTAWDRSWSVAGWSASSNGSGRSITNDSTAAAPTNTTGTRYGPASSGRPKFSATSPENATRFGPITAPIVAPQTTTPIVDARLRIGTRSAAA
jgi:hypothetical protein